VKWVLRFLGVLGVLVLGLVVYVLLLVLSL
jgi:hypothetical protein